LAVGSARFRAILRADITTHSRYPVLLEWHCLADAGPEAPAAAGSEPTRYGQYLPSMARLRAFISIDVSTARNHEET